MNRTLVAVLAAGLVAAPAAIARPAPDPADVAAAAAISPPRVKQNCAGQMGGARHHRGALRRPA